MRFTQPCAFAPRSCAISVVLPILGHHAGGGRLHREHAMKATYWAQFEDGTEQEITREYASMVAERDHLRKLASEAIRGPVSEFDLLLASSRADRQRLDEATRENDILQRRPKPTQTVDGVPVQHGDTVYFRRHSGGQAIQGRAELVSWEMECDDRATNSYSPKVIHGLGDLYSSQEAAESARAES